jgi:N-acyl-phosphatidylethanolamine-hydrolysing phospholipase D
MRGARFSSSVPAQMASTRFSNPWPHAEHGFSDILLWKLGKMEKDHEPYPDRPAALMPDAQIPPMPTEGWQVTWLGHSSFLLQGAGRRFLIDPILSKYCSPLPIPTLRRLSPAPFTLEQLGKIDAVFLTHAHYDHCDVSTLRKLPADTPVYAPKGHLWWLERKALYAAGSAGWHESIEPFPGIKATLTPAQHFTARTPWDRNKALWGGWLFEGAGKKIWHAGDSGYCPAFQEIGEKYGPIDLGLIPIGAYAPRSIMKAMHMNPSEAVDVFHETRCRKAIAMHWGTFRLTDEPMGAPPERLQEALQEKPGDFVVGQVGESWAVL